MKKNWWCKFGAIFKIGPFMGLFTTWQKEPNENFENNTFIQPFNPNSMQNIKRTHFCKFELWSENSIFRRFWHFCKLSKARISPKYQDLASQINGPLTSWKITKQSYWANSEKTALHANGGEYVVPCQQKEPWSLSNTVFWVDILSAFKFYVKETPN